MLIAITGCTASDTVKIAFLGDLSGPLSTHGQYSLQAVEMAIEEINKDGGINGKQVELVTGDSRCTGRTGTTVMQRFSDQGVDGVVGALCSSVSIPAYEVAERHQVPMVSFASSSPRLTRETPLFYRTFPADDLQMQHAAELAVSQGLDSVAILYQDDEWGVSVKDAFIKHASDVHISEALQLAEDSRTQLERIRQSDPDAIMIMALPEGTRRVLRDMHELGINATIMSVKENFNEQFASTPGANGMIGVKPVRPDSTVHERFEKEFKNRYNATPGFLGSYAYDATYLLKALLEQCPRETCTPEIVGASGNVTLDEHGDRVVEYRDVVITNGSVTAIR